MGLAVLLLHRKALRYRRHSKGKPIVCFPLRVYFKPHKILNFIINVVVISDIGTMARFSALLAVAWVLLMTGVVPIDVDFKDLSKSILVQRAGLTNTQIL